MPPDFFRTLRALERGKTHSFPLSAILALGLIGAWLTWFTLSRVAVLEVSERSRVEVQSPPLRLTAPVAGRLTLFLLSLNRRVERGEVVAEIDCTVERQRLREEQARRTGLDAELLTLQREIDALKQAQDAEQQVARMSSLIAAARFEEAARRTAQAEEVAERYRRLAGAAAEIDVRRTWSEAGQEQAARTALRAEERRLRRERRALRLKGGVRIEELERQRTALSSRCSTSAAAIEIIEAEIARHVLRAPVAGFIDAVAPLGLGAFVQAGDTLGVLLPTAGLHVVAMYQPAGAFGRIAPGQRAWMRLSGFPFTQFGRLPLRVTRRANEVQDGLVRVELTVDPSIPFPVPLQHGLPGTVDIEVERISPLRLILRTLGSLGTRNDQTPAAESVR